MRSCALIVALYLTSTLCACAQPGGPPPGYGQAGGQAGGQPGGQPGYGQDSGPPPAIGGQGAPPAYAQQGWAGGMQSAPGQVQPNAPPPVAQGGPPPMAQGAPPGKEHGMAAKFRRANTTGDGRLTQQQAQAGGMGGVARNFAQVDRDQKGYVTLQDVRVWHQAKHARKMQQRQAQGQSAGAPSGAYPPPAQNGQQY